MEIENIKMAAKWKEKKLTLLGFPTAEQFVDAASLTDVMGVK
jgi:hypothetical protein